VEGKGAGGGGRKAAACWVKNAARAAVWQQGWAAVLKQTRPKTTLQPHIHTHMAALAVFATTGYCTTGYMEGH
jgi:hypothetical protein